MYEPNGTEAEQLVVTPSSRRRCSVRLFAIVAGIVRRRLESYDASEARLLLARNSHEFG